jgi:hypothetical protein
MTKKRKRSSNPVQHVDKGCSSFGDELSSAFDHLEQSHLNDMRKLRRHLFTKTTNRIMERLLVLFREQNAPYAMKKKMLMQNTIENENKRTNSPLRTIQTVSSTSDQQSVTIQPENDNVQDNQVSNKRRLRSNTKLK